MARPTGCGVLTITPATEVRGSGRWKTVALLALTGCALLTLTSCSKSLSANSSCKDFLNASASAQQHAIDKIAVQENAPNATTPLGMPNVSYLCAGDPNQTLGWAIQHTG